MKLASSSFISTVVCATHPSGLEEEYLVIISYQLEAASVPEVARLVVEPLRKEDATIARAYSVPSEHMSTQLSVSDPDRERERKMGCPFGIFHHFPR